MLPSLQIQVGRFLEGSGNLLHLKLVEFAPPLIRFSYLDGRASLTVKILERNRFSAETSDVAMRRVIEAVSKSWSGLTISSFLGKLVSDYYYIYIVSRTADVDPVFGALATPFSETPTVAPPRPHTVESEELPDGLGAFLSNVRSAAHDYRQSAADVVFYFEVYKDGFVWNRDGILRRLSDPRNAAMFSELQQGTVPDELNPSGAQEIDLHVIVRSGTNYIDRPPETDMPIVQPEPPPQRPETPEFLLPSVDETVRWFCGRCAYRNPPGASDASCEICESTKPGCVLGGEFPHWICSRCPQNNKDGNVVCTLCGEEKKKGRFIVSEIERVPTPAPAVPSITPVPLPTPVAMTPLGQTQGPVEVLPLRRSGSSLAPVTPLDGEEDEAEGESQESSPKKNKPAPMYLSTFPDLGWGSAVTPLEAESDLPMGFDGESGIRKKED